MLSFIEVLAVIVVFFPLCLCFICISYQERLELLKYDSMGVGLYIYLLLVFLIHLVFFLYMQFYYTAYNFWAILIIIILSILLFLDHGLTL
jgi:hypothetical protein